MMSKKAENKNVKLNQKTQLKKSIQMQEDSDMSDDLDNDEEMDSGIKMLFLEERYRRRQIKAKSLYVDNLPKHVSCAEMKSLSGDIQHSVHFSRETRSIAHLIFESEEKAEENFKLLKGKTFKDRILYIDYMGDKSKHIQYDPKLYMWTTLVLPFVPFNCTLHEVAQHFPSCSQVRLAERSDKFAEIRFKKKQDADTAFLANKSVNIKDMEIPVLHKQKKKIFSDGPEAGRRFKEEFNNRGGFRGETQVHKGFRGGRGGFRRGFIARGNGFKGAELGGERGVRRAERGSGRGFHRDGPDAGGRFKEEFNNRGGFRGRFGGSPRFRGGIQGHIGFRGSRGGFGRGFIARGSGFRAAVLGGGRGFSARGRGFRGAERGSGRGVQKRYFN